jgi:hypothetical protein
MREAPRCRQAEAGIKLGSAAGVQKTLVVNNCSKVSVKAGRCELRRRLNRCLRVEILKTLLEPWTIIFHGKSLGNDLQIDPAAAGVEAA